MSHDINTLQKKILKRFLMLAFIAGISIFGILVYPLYEKMNDEALTEIHHIGSLKKALLGSEVKQMLMVSKQISNRTVLRELLTLFNNGVITERRLQDDSEKLLLDAFKASDMILGIHRFDNRHTPVVNLGVDIDYGKFNPESIKGAKDFVFGLVDCENTSQFYAISHILDDHNKSIGFDVIIFNDKATKSILEKKEHTNNSMIFCIGTNNQKGFYPILSNDNPYAGEKTALGSVCSDKKVYDIHRYDIKDSNIEFRVMLTKGVWSEKIYSKIIRIILASILIFLVAAAWGTLSTWTLFDKLREQQVSLKTILKEKSTLLRELNHRTLNNLQMMLSIIRIKSRTTESPEAKRVLEECQNRLQSIAFIQERVFRLDSSKSVDIACFLPEIIKNIRTIHDKQNSGLLIRIDSIHLQTKKASLCALIINELLTNVYKHAFTGEAKQWNVTVHAHHQSKNNIEMTVEDNGTGIATSALENGEEGMGINLVKDMIERQLHGSYKITSENGTRWEIYFKGDEDV